jgi:hypothetical protein
MELQKLPKSVRNLYLGIKIKCSVSGCEAVVPLRDLFRHENFCGAKKCENIKLCQNTAPLMILDKRVCSEKCYIYTKLSEGFKIPDELLFKLLNNFTDNMGNNNGMIRIFNSFWIDYCSPKELKLARNAFEQEGRRELPLTMEFDQEIATDTHGAALAIDNSLKGLKVLSTTNSVKNMSSKKCYKSAVAAYVSLVGLF